MHNKSNIYIDYSFYIQQIFAEINNISDDEECKFVLKEITLKKNDFLLNEGEYCKNIYYLKSGIFRNYYIKEGNEIITSFAFPSDISTILRSILLNEPSREYIQAVTDCDLYSIAIESYQKIKSRYSIIDKIDAKITQLYALMLEERLFSLKFHTAAERYQILLEREPLIVKYIPLTYIASYLGITLETLSRIRAQK